MSANWIRNRISKALDNNDGNLVQLLNQLQLIHDLQNGGSQHSKQELLETLKKLFKCSKKTSLTREVITEIEKAINKLKSQCNEKSDDAHTDSYNDESKSSPRKPKHTKHESCGEGDQRDRREWDRSREGRSKAKTTHNRSQDIISSVLSCTTKYDEIRESYVSKIVPYDDTSSSDETSNPSPSERNCRSSNDRHRQNSFKDGFQDINGKNASRSSFVPPRYWDLTTDRSGSRSPSRRRGSCEKRRRKHSPDKRAKRRSRSRDRRSQCRNTSRRLPTFVPHCDLTTDRSASRSPSRRSGSCEKRRRRYSPDKRAKRRSRSRDRDRRTNWRDTSFTPYTLVPQRHYDLTTDRSASRSPSRRRSSCEKRRRWCSPDGEKRSSRCRSRRTKRHRRRHSPPRVKKERSQSSNQAEFCEEPNGSNSSIKPESSPQSHANCSLLKEIRKKIQSKLLGSSNCGDSADNSVMESSRRNNLFGWQGEFDLSSEPFGESTVNLDVKTESGNQGTSQIDKLALDAKRKKIAFSFTNSMKEKKLKESKVFKTDASSNNLTDVRSNLSNILQSALNDRKNIGKVASNGPPCESPSAQQESIEFDDPRGEIVENADIAFVTNVTNDSIDNEIIQKITSQLAGDSHAQSPYDELVPNISFDFDSVKQAIATARMAQRMNQNTQVVRTNCSKLPTPRISLPTPSTKFLPPAPFQPPAPFRVQTPFKIPAIPNNNINLPKFSGFRTPTKTNDVRPKNQQIVQRRATSFVDRKGLPSAPIQIPAPFKLPAIPNNNINPQKSSGFKAPTKTNDEQRPKNQKIVQRRATSFVEKKDLPANFRQPVWNFKIPKKSKKMNHSTSVKESDLQVKEETGNIIEIDDDSENCDHPLPQPEQNTNDERDKHSIGIPSREELAVNTLKEFPISNIKGGDGSSNSSSSVKNTTTINQKQKPQTMVTRSRSLSPKSKCTEGFIIDRLLIKRSRVSLQRIDVELLTEKATFKNIHPEWHSLKKIVKCQLCDKSHGISLVSHYVNRHPQSEVLISRLSPEAAEALRSGKVINDCQVIRKNSYQSMYKQFCHFCNGYITHIRDHWIGHMAVHTGYYRFKCNDCSKLFSCRPNKGKCHDMNDFEKISQPQFKENILLAFVCDLCNYVRFHQNEIKTHLIREHEDDPKKFQKFEFLSFPRYKSKQRRSSAVEDFLANMTNSDDDVDSESESETGSDEDWDSTKNESVWDSDLDSDDLLEVAGEWDESDS